MNLFPDDGCVISAGRHPSQNDGLFPTGSYSDYETGMETKPPSDLLYTNLTQDQARIYMLVLEAKHIDYRCAKTAAGWQILVRFHQLPYARKQIEIYLAENKNATSSPPPQSHNIEKNYSMIWIAIALIAIHWAIESGADKKILVQSLGASSEAILKGQLFRCLTALTLHTDAAHLCGNLAGLMLFGTLLCRRMGTGVGWFLILTGGACGNLQNALLHQTSHLSIGASTAVFSCIGSLCAYTAKHRSEVVSSKRKALIPLGAGFAFLALLGANPETDIWAHFFGFISGLFLSFIWAGSFPQKLQTKSQWGLAALSTAIMIAAWIQGLQRF